MYVCIYSMHVCYSLQILSLGGNKLTEVPTGVGDLHMLQALVLCDNHLESLPASIANLHQLKSLLLHKNHLRTLPPEIVALKNLTEVLHGYVTLTILLLSIGYLLIDLQLSLRDNPLVVRFVSDMTHTPGTLLELAARAVKVHDLPVRPGDIPHHLICYLQSGHRCVNPRCKGTYIHTYIPGILYTYMYMYMMIG